MRTIDADLIQYEPMLSPKGNGQYEEVSVAYKSQIDDLPTIEERKKGKWIYTRPYSAINCSSCHHCSWSMPYEDLVKSFNYCPNCGSYNGGET